jgi:hypothetical protein
MASVIAIPVSKMSRLHSAISIAAAIAIFFEGAYLNGAAHKQTYLVALGVLVTASILYLCVRAVMRWCAKVDRIIYLLQNISDNAEWSNHFALLDNKE